VKYGVEDCSSIEVERALRQANASEFVNNHSLFPEGLKTIVGERGVKLSGGQK